MIEQSVNKEIFEDGVPMPGRIWAVLSSALTIFMSCIEGSIVNIALPVLATQFNVSSSASIWIVNGYQLMTVMCLLSVSFLADLKGFRKIYLSGIALFVIASFLCAVSNSFTMLVICSAFQGIASAGIVGVNIGMLREIYPKRLLGRGIGLNAMVVSVAAVSGPSVAGAILAVASWHWLYAVNIPFGILALILGYRFLPRNEKRIKAEFDVWGAVLNALLFFLLIYSLMGYAHGEKPIFVIIQLAALPFVAVIYYRRENKMKNPIFPVDLMKVPIFSRSIFTSNCSFAAQMLVLISFPFFLQYVAGKSPAMTGLLITPWPVAVLITAPIAGFLLEKIHPGILGFIGMTIFACSLLALTFLTADSSSLRITLNLVACGIGFGLFQTPNNTTIVSTAPANRGGAASGMIGVARLMGQCFGAALVALFFKIVPDQASSIRICQYIACGFAVIAAVLSLSRVKYAVPGEK